VKLLFLRLNSEVTGNKLKSFQPHDLLCNAKTRRIESFDYLAVSCKNFKFATTIKKVQGVWSSPNSHKSIEKTKVDDLLLFHLVRRPTGGIVATSKIDRFENNPIPLCNLYDHPSDEFSIGPWFHTIVITPISSQQYENIRNFFPNKNMFD
jgi:hypothetical protein